MLGRYRLARSVLASSVSSAVGLISAQPALAAETAPSAQTVQEVIVTGSRLPRPDLEANSPIAILDRRQLEDRGFLTLDIALNRMPQVTPSYSSASNSPDAAGASYVDLRGLGISRNLVLLDGRRVVGGNNANAVDLNTIPNPLIERVEVITGGASAVYGADAVAGVVNVILKRDFDGVELSGRTLISERGDGAEQDLSVTVGRSFTRGRIMGGLEWTRRDGIDKGARAFSAQAPNISAFFPLGSYVTGANPPSQAAVDAVFARYGVAPGAVPRRGSNAGFGFNADGTLFGPGIQGTPIDVQN